MKPAVSAQFRRAAKEAVSLPLTKEEQEIALIPYEIP